MTRFTWLSILAVLALVFGFSACSQATQTHLLCIMEGRQETPPNASTASGYGEFLYDDSTHILHYELTVYGLSATESAAHIHTGAPGVAGGVTFPLTVGGYVEGDIPNVTTGEATTLLSGGMYANAHDSLYPNGEIRGQIRVINYVATLEAAQESSVGDSPAYALGWFVFNSADSSLAYYIEAGIGMETAEVGAHIHGPAAMGVDADAIYVLPSGFPKVGVWHGMSTAQMGYVTSGMTYANVHSQENPDGEIRGQILAGNVPPPLHRTGMIAILNSAQESNAADTSSAKGYAALELNTLAHTLALTLYYTGITPTIGHIHTGARGVSGGVTFPFTGVNASNIYSTVITTTTDQEATLLAGGMYINLHTSAFPNGEIRGQIDPVTYFAQLDGSQEVPPVESGSTAKAWFAMGSNWLEWLVVPYDGAIINETAAHIHAPAAPGGNAGVQIGLGAAEPKFGVSTITTAQMNWIMNDSAYVNIHTQANPNGEIRGWITPGNLPFPSEDLAVKEPPTRALQPNGFGLLGAYPNPFNPTTRITVNLLRTSNISVAVFDVSGREVTELHRGTLPAGTSSFTFDGARLTSGIYFVRATGANFNAVQKIALVK